MLLSIGVGDQASLQRDFKRIRRKVQSSWQIPGHANSIVFTAQKVALALVAFKGNDISIDERNGMLRNAGVSALDHSSQDRSLVIGVDVDHAPAGQATRTVCSPGLLIKRQNRALIVPSRARLRSDQLWNR